MGETISNKGGNTLSIPYVSTRSARFSLVMGGCTEYLSTPLRDAALSKSQVVNGLVCLTVNIINPNPSQLMKPDLQIIPGRYFRQCVGIDVSKDSLTACLQMYDIASDAGCHSVPVEFVNDRHGFNQLVRWVRKECLKGYPLSFLMETTGVYHELLASHLHRIGMTVYVVLPNKAKDFAGYEGIKTKTDSTDARSLALLGCACRSLRPWNPPKPLYRELRNMTRFASDIKKVRTILTNHLEALEHGMSPCKDTIGYYKRLVMNINGMLEHNEQNIRSKVETDPELAAAVGRLETIKGIGYFSVVSIIAETEGFHMISNRKQLASYAGLDVSARQSGRIDTGHRISKRGNARIREALYFPAISACRFNRQIHTAYERICAKAPAKKVGITAAMRKMLLLMYTLWKNKEEYDQER